VEAYEGYFENGRFIPKERVTLPERSEAVLVIAGIPQKPKPKNDDIGTWLEEFHRMTASIKGEKLRDEDFPRMNFGREAVTFSDEG